MSLSTGMPLVTGASGFAGSHLLDQLLDAEGQAAAWGNPSGRTARHLDGDRRVAWSAVDVTDDDQVTPALAALRPTVIYHCAGIADVRASWSDAARALRVNVIGTHVILGSLSRLQLAAPVVVTGSALVYRQSSDALDEDSPLGPSSPYGLSKLAQELVARDSVAPVVVTRSFNHAGPRQSDSYVTSSFARQIAQAEAGLRPAVLQVGNLDARRDTTDVRDVARAYRLLARHGRPHHAYNVCCGEAFRIGDLLEMLLGLARVRIRVEVDPARLRPSDNPVVVGNPARLVNDTGWHPEIPIERTLHDLLAFWRLSIESGGAR